MTLIADWNVNNPVTYQRMRQLLFEQGGGIQEGVIGATDLKVVQRGAGANQSVDVGSGAAWVQIETGTRNGLGHVYNDATANVTVTASNGTNPRVDQILLRWNDTSIPTGAGNVPTLEVLTGTATGGATLDNRTGATALPNDCLRLADILVPAASSSVTTANIRDRRPWSRGYVNIQASPTGADFTTASTTFVVVDSTNLQQRVECSGAPIRALFQAQVSQSTNSFNVALDVDGTPTLAGAMQTLATTGFINLSAFFYIAAPAAGSHLLTPKVKVNTSGTLTIHRSTVSTISPTPWFMVEEIVKPNANNGIA